MRRTTLILQCVLLIAAMSGLARGEGFSAAVSPGRFEMTAKAGDLLRGVIEITNTGLTQAEFLLRTADWTLAKDFSVSFMDDLQPNSCRPWVTLERPSVSLPGGAVMRYRYEVRVPPGTAASECRFAIMIEGKETSSVKTGAVSLPVAGRIGVIVYVSVGNAAPVLEIFGATRVQANGREVPAVRVHNTGNAHGRLTGFLSGTDAKGIKYDFRPANFPILPQEEVYINLTPSTGSDDNPVLTYPVRVQGKLEWGNQQSNFDEQFR